MSRFTDLFQPKPAPAPAPVVEDKNEEVVVESNKALQVTRWKNRKEK